MNMEVTPREKRQQRTYDAILEAARQLVGEGGINALSMREIARRIEYSPAALYEYFGSKEEIVAALCEEGFRRLTAALQRTPTSLSPEAYLLEAGRNYVRFALNNSDYFSLMFSTMHLGGADSTATPDAWKNHLRQSPAFLQLEVAVRRLAVAGHIDATCDDEIFAHAISNWQIVHGVATLGIALAPSATHYEKFIERGLTDHLVGTGNRRSE